MKKLKVVWHKLAGAAVLVWLAFHGAPAAAQDRVLVYEGEGAFPVFGWSDFGVATGKTIEELTPLPDDLSVYDCIVLPANGFIGAAFSQQTLDDLNDYVSDGGRIIAQAERTGFGGTIQAMNDLASDLGSDLSVVSQELDCDVGFVSTTNIDSSPFTAGVFDISYSCTSGVAVAVGPDAESLVRTTGGTTFIGVDTIGSGLFVLSGDLNVFVDFPFGAADAYTNHDNGVLAENLCDKVGGAVPPSQFLLIDEDSITTGNPPNFFTDNQVNKDDAEIGVRTQLPFFAANVGNTITLHTGQVGDEGWFALKTIPDSWADTDPTDDGLLNYLGAGPGLGGGSDPEGLLDKVPDVTPLRASGLKLLEGQQVCAVVYDSDISINYDPLDGSLKGKNRGTVAFEVVSVTALTGWSSSALPQVEIEILDAEEVCGGPLELFTDAPEPDSSSEPFDVEP